jgi:glucose-1-phosphate cytidylyltransferase
MKTIILAGGLGTRLSEETREKPKPMVLLGERPILWHIMSIYAAQGFSDFVIAAGYKSEVIRDWVKKSELSWKVEVINTGQDTQTGGRIKKCIEIFNDKEFFATYGDGLANVNLQKLIACHKSSNSLATLTAVRPPARFGALMIKNNTVERFGEKVQSDSGWINGGFFLLNRKIEKYIEDYMDPFEIGALPRLVSEGKLSALKHYGFWQPMDTLREKHELQSLVESKNLPWLKIDSV